MVVGDALTVVTPLAFAQRLQKATDFIAIGITVCDLTRRLDVDDCTVAFYGRDRSPRLLIDNATVSDQERVSYITEGWRSDLSLRTLHQHHSEVAGEQSLLLPILAPEYLLGSIRCRCEVALHAACRRDLGTLSNYVSMRITQLGIAARPDPTIACLTQRQLEVARLVTLTNAQIGERLGLKENTVKKHLKDVFLKLGVNNRTECAARIGQPSPRTALPTTGASPHQVSRVGSIAITRANANPSPD